MIGGARRLHYLAVAVVAVMLGTLAAVPTPLQAAVGGAERGDLVKVTVYGQEDLTTMARVSSDNTISFPFIGQVRVGGISISEAQNNIARALEREGIVRNPQVNVLVEMEGSASGDFVTILGHVQQPGRYALGEESEVGAQTLLDLLAAAGGTTETADTEVIVYRNGADGEKRFEVDVEDLVAGGKLKDVNLALSAGDVVIVPETDVFYIYGQVGRPGRYPLQDRMMVMHAISVGGGVTERGQESGIVLTRRNGQQSERMDAKLSDPIQPDDVIYVKEKFF